MADIDPVALRSVQAESDLKALTATTPEGVPDELRALVGRKGCQEFPDMAWEITAVEPGTQTRWVPDGELPNGTTLSGWHWNRVYGRPVVPPSKQITESGYYARVMGNAVALEDWLRHHGWHNAFAGSPHAVWIGELCKGIMRPCSNTYGYEVCDVCDRIMEAAL
jgi:hypothetical protein